MAITKFISRIIYLLDFAAQRRKRFLTEIGLTKYEKHFIFNLKEYQTAFRWRLAGNRELHVTIFSYPGYYRVMDLWIIGRINDFDFIRFPS